MRTENPMRLAESINRGDAIRVILRFRRPENSPAQNQMLTGIQSYLYDLPAIDDDSVENVGRVPADTDPVLIAALRCSATVGGDKDCASCAYGCRVGDHMPPDAQVLLRVLADEPDCDCDRIALDAAQRLEELTEVRTNEKHK